MKILAFLNVLYFFASAFFVPFFSTQHLPSISRIPLPMQKTSVPSLGWKDPLEKEMAAHSSIFKGGKSMDREVWWATVHGVQKSQI